MWHGLGVVRVEDFRRGLYAPCGFFFDAKLKDIRLPMPTHAQAISSVCICQSLSDTLQPIHLFRYDASHKQIYILAGINEGIEITIFENGNWEFYEDVKS